MGLGNGGWVWGMEDGFGEWRSGKGTGAEPGSDSVNMGIKTLRHLAAAL